MKKYEEDYDFSNLPENHYKCLLATSNYNNSGNDYRRVSISGDRGKKVNYMGECYPDLAPKKEFWEVWHNNIGKISEEDNLKYYIEQYYKQVLSKIKYSDIEKFLFYPNERIILCYEDPTEFCHRHIFVSWIKLLYGIEIPEVKLTDVRYGTDNTVIGQRFTPTDRFPLEKLEEILEKAMKADITNMRGFTSLMALRLFNQAEAIEQEAYLLEEKTGKDYCGMHMTAAGLRVQADDAEQDYRELHIKSKGRVLQK